MLHHPPAFAVSLLVCAAFSAAATAAPQLPGAEVYEHYCAACHATGQLKAPRFGDRKAWRPLIAEGQAMLSRTAIRGIRKMPPKGGHPHLSDLEVKRAVAYMANQAGGKFKTHE
ncbi:MAG TPA: c-type cytochrome [Thiobacillaceae bacterium]|nr:c-type cytochrome [Thiobacillaceae bacterium]